MRKFFQSVVLLIITAAALLAQTDRATLRGTVADPSGAFVPGAEMVVTEIGTNIEARRVTSDDNGNYEVPSLKPGTYRVKADKAGFRSFVADNVLLDAGQTRRVDITLQMGATAETVTVEAGAALIQTETGTISGELDKKKFADRPQVDVYPSPLALMTTMPGIQGNGWNLVMSGISDRQKQTWAMDGVANDTAGDQNDNPAFFETVQVTSVSGGADSSRAANFNMISKSGSNAWHGDAIYKHENAGLNARETFAARKTPYILHEAEASLTGPIIKDRTFFYVAWFHQTIPLGSYQLKNVPTDLMRTGDFSQFIAQNKIIKDPTNGTPFPGNVIPSARFNDVSKKTLDLYIPKATRGGPDNMTNNYGYDFPYNSDLYKGDWPYFRIDHKLSDKNTAYVRWMRRKTPYIRPSYAPWAIWTQSRDHRQLVASDTHVFSPTLVNTFTFGHQTDFMLLGEQEKDIKPQTGDAAVKAIGLQGVNSRGLSTMGFPKMDINGLTQIYSNDGAIDNVDQNNGVNTFSDTLTWNKGKHVLKVGGEARAYWWRGANVGGNAYGYMNFNGTITGAGIGFADFLLGIPYNTQRNEPLVNRRNVNKQLGFFFADTFKVTAKLTLDYGLRWDYYGITTYDDGLMYNFDLKTGSVVVQPDAISKIHPLYQRAIGTTPIITGQVVPSPDKKNFRPRISAAYRLTSKTVLRGGYGEFTDSWDYNSRRPGNSPFAMSESYNNVVTNGVPLFSLPNPFPSSIASSTVSGQSVTALPLETNNGTIRQFNFTLEREIGSFGLRLSYIGMRNTGLNYGAGTSATYNMNKPQPSTTPFTQSRRPYNQLQSVNVFGTDGRVHYNAAQFEIQKRAGAFTFNSNFTWSKNMYNWANTENPYDITSKWAHDQNNREKYWVTSLTWQIPVGRQQRFLSSAPKAVDFVLGGWATQFVSTFASPTWQSPSYNNSNGVADPSGTNTNGGLPDAIGDPLSGFTRTVNHWFNEKAFAPPPLGRFGNATPYSVPAYGINVQHLSLAKSFHITERFKTTFTGAFSNLMNHPHYSSINMNVQNADPGKFTATRPNYEPEKQSYRQVDLKIRFEF